MERKNAWKKYPQGKREVVFAFAEDYKKFISDCKTERECVTELIAQAREAGFEDLEKIISEGRKLQAGDKLYARNMDKTLALFVIGRQPLEKGMNILGAHIDSPRLDLKQVPLYEDTEMALLDTHYYGGVKKYQWVTLPLALHGVVVKKDGTKVTVNIGEKDDDPVFGISDLLIHLASEQLDKKAAKVIEGENLDLLVGSIPFESEDEKEKAKDAVKTNVLNILKEQYDIEEEDFLSAEIEVVPAGKPGITDLTAVWSWVMVMMTEYVHILLLRQSWKQEYVRRQLCAFWLIKRKSAVWAQLVCSPNSSSMQCRRLWKRWAVTARFHLTVQ